MELKRVEHSKSRRGMYPDKHTTKFCFDIETCGKYHIAVKNGKVDEYPEQRSVDTLPSDTARVLCNTILLAHAHFNPRYTFDGLKYLDDE